METYYCLKQREREKREAEESDFASFTLVSILSHPHPISISCFCSVEDKEAQMGNSRYLITSQWIG